MNWRDLRQEFRPMFTLAIPVVLAELGWVTMGLVDTLMVGGLGPEAIGAVGIGTSLFMGVCIFAMGLLLGLDTLVAQSFGAGRVDECHRWLAHGIVLSLLLTAPVMLVLRLLSSALGAWGLNPLVLELLRPYLDALTWSVLPLLLYASFRRYLQGMGAVRPVMVALITANLVNLFANWVLIYGRLGAPRMGVGGSAWATVIARIGMAGVLLCVILQRERGRRPGLFATPLRIEIARMRRLLSLGFPAASQVTLEVGVFAAATALAGKLAPASLAAHQIAINIVAFTFMVPLGVASAGAVRVGHAVGRHDGAGAVRSGWTALLFGTFFMSCAAVVFLLAPRQLIGAFTPDTGVIETGVSLLLVGALFQLFDGVQGVATGVLRGLGDTRTPMLWNLAAHWFIGLPVGYALCFVAGYGVIGLWWGLSLGLVICGVALLAVWARRARQLSLIPNP
ncbi:MAG TPA: MATE family efflux transporter [Vicinamibacterales bacterium]|nr:MATE family efflux transporter [Vicinamibacterales bacterium]